MQKEPTRGPLTLRGIELRGGEARKRTSPNRTSSIVDYSIVIFKKTVSCFVSYSQFFVILS